MIKVRIIIVESDGINETLNFINSGRLNEGTYLSKANKINVNKTVYGYSIIIPSMEFCSMDRQKYLSSILKLLIKNLPDQVFRFDLKYYCESNEEWYFNPVTAKIVLGFNYFMSKLAEGARIKEFQYVEDEEYMAGLLNDLNDSESDEYDWSGIDSDDDFDDDETEEEEPMDPFKFIMNGEYSMKKSKKKKKSSKRFDNDIEKSRSFKNAVRPKRSISRHGVIIADSKSDIRKDEKIIREFLKEFIPGGGWRKEFREEVLHRWMASYVISKKRLSKLQKKHKRNKSRRRGSKVTSAVSKMLLQNDAWYNPSR